MGAVFVLRAEGMDIGPPAVTAWRTFAGGTTPSHSGKSWRRHEQAPLAFGCPLCRAWSQVSESALGTELPCPHCGKKLKLNPFVIKADWRPVAAAWRGEKD